MPVRRHFLFLGLMASLGSGQSTAAPPSLPLDLHGSEPVPAQIDRIRSDLDDGKTYVELGSEQRGSVLAALDRLEAAGAQAGGAQLSGTAPVSVASDQALVNEILTKAREDSRLICRREAKVGSNMLTSQCMTAAERRRAQERGKQGLDDLRSRTYSKEL